MKKVFYKSRSAEKQKSRKAEEQKSRNFLRSYGLTVLWSYGLMVLRSYGLMVLRSYGLTVFLLSAFSFLLSPLSAQVDENRILDSVLIQKNEVRITPEVEKKVIDVVHWMYKELSESSRPRIKNWSQSENFALGKPIPTYRIKNEKLLFTNTWHVPVLCDGEPLILVDGVIEDNFFSVTGCQNTPLEEHIHNYVHKDLLIGTLCVKNTNKIDYLIIRKGSNDVFVKIFDETTGEYLKDEYTFSEIINFVKERANTEEQNRVRYFEKVASKGELIITHEIEEIVFRRFRNASEIFYPTLGIKNKEQLTNLELGKPIPYYRLHNDSLQFTGSWEVPVMSDSVPFYMANIKLLDDGQYKYVGGGAGMAEAIRNYEHKDLLIGFLGTQEGGYLIIRKNGKDIFVKAYDWETREVFKTEHTLNDIINLNKK